MRSALHAMNRTRIAKAVLKCGDDVIGGRNRGTGAVKT
jgi:hypothetical protein